MGEIWGISPPPYSPIFSPYFPHIFYGGIDVLVYWCTASVRYLPTHPSNTIFDVSLTHEDYMVVSPYKKGKPADVLVWAERRVTL